MVELHLNPASLSAYSVLVIITQKHQITCLGSHSFSVGSWDYSQFLDSKEGTPACIWGVTVELFSGWLYQNHAANYCLIAIISQELYSNYLPAESSVANKTNKQAKTSRQTRFAESYSSPLNFASSPRPLLRNELLVEYEDRLLLGASPASQAARYIQSVGSDNQRNWDSNTSSATHQFCFVFLHQIDLFPKLHWASASSSTNVSISTNGICRRYLPWILWKLNVRAHVKHKSLSPHHLL